MPSETVIRSIVKRALNLYSNELVQSKFIENYTIRPCALYVDLKENIKVCFPYIKENYNIEEDSDNPNTFVLHLPELEAKTKDEIITEYSYINNINIADICNDIIRAETENFDNIIEYQQKITTYIEYLRVGQYSNLMYQIADALYNDEMTHYDIEITLIALRRNYEIFKGWRYDPLEDEGN